ncbi:MAG TPA: T9SS type A sorting domain-containing protein, partial [Bacteroidia bacterium]|nr:T9SS type A sorting domain-containing protein [Bacteroidia bacterium]
VLACGLTQAQAFVDTLYSYHDTTLQYGAAVDFGGVTRTLAMDVSVPTNDTPPPNGRPLMLLVHGGAFMAGTKVDPGIVAMRRDFAKRGYVTAAIDYRLGMFQPAGDWHCNISFIQGVEWDCLNQTDTLEWTRAYYRGIQDVRGALRYLVNHAADFNLDPQNIFVVGESAGAFISMGVGFMDDPSEKPAGVGAIADAPLPNARYEQGCLVRYGTGTTNAALVRTRPDLGSYDGTLNQPAASSYRIRGVGDLFGAVFNDLFATNANDAEIPCLYIFHQPADLIVPDDRARVLAGYAYCATLWPANCAYILNRPFVSGGVTIKSLIDAHALAGDSVPDYLAEFTNNNADCATQIGNPALGGHQLDNYWTRTYNMAVFFAPKIDTTIVGTQDPLAEFNVQVYPNPSQGQFRVVVPNGLAVQGLRVSDLMGKTIHQSAENGHDFTVKIPQQLARGTYILQIQTLQGNMARRIVLE